MEEDGLWYDLNLKDGVEYMEVPAIALASVPTSVNAEFEDWEYYYGELPDGHYRLLKSGWLEDADGTRSETIWLTAEFTITG